MNNQSDDAVTSPDASDLIDSFQSAGFSWLWVAVGIAIISVCIVKSILARTHSLEMADYLALFGLAVGLATFVLVGYQVVLGVQQTKILMRQDEILLRREELDVFFDQGFEFQLSRRFTIDAALDSGNVQFLLPVTVQNKGRRVADEWHVTLFLPPVDGRAFMLTAFRGWNQLAATRLINEVRCVAYFRRGTEHLFPGQSLTVEAAGVITPGIGDVTVYWSASGENGVYPGKDQFGVLTIGMRDPRYLAK